MYSRKFSKELVLILMGVAVCFALATTASALPINIGDVFATTARTALNQLGDELKFGQIKHYDKDLNLLETLETNELGYVAGMAFDASLNLYATSGFFAENFGGANTGTILRFKASDGSLLGTFGSGYSQYPESILFDAAGNVYVGNVAIDVTNPADRDIRKFSPTGSPLTQFDVEIEDQGSDWIDLAADQKTMFYTSEGRRIMRYDVSTGTQLPDFVTLPTDIINQKAFALRLLGDGGLLVADSVNIKRLDSSGAVVQTYDASGADGWFALNLDPDGTSFWSGAFNTDTFYKFDIDTGVGIDNYLTSTNTLGGGGTLFGFTVAGEITQAQSIIPEPGSWLLFSVGLLALAGALIRRRRR
ncbi:PEP-CTERM sorting domain-containing protein [Candidatus Poribacteria bacterium]|nr:PEP-CTERM sorting domain-containing protein [Candidatus Poribacteria bacterium]